MLATVGPILIKVVYEIGQGTSEMGLNLRKYLEESPKTAVVYTGFTMTMIATLTAFLADSPDYVVGWILLLGMFGTVASVLLVLLLEVFEVVEPLLNVVVEILEILARLMDLWIKLLEEVFGLVDKVLGVFG